MRLFAAGVMVGAMAYPAGRLAGYAIARITGASRPRGYAFGV